MATPKLEHKKKKKKNKIRIQKSFVFVYSCWGFTAQPTQWGHIERDQLT